MTIKTIGITERVKVKAEKTEEVIAIVDTGARLTSIDKKLAERVGTGEIIRHFTVKAPAMKTTTKRPVVEVKMEIAGEEFEAEANIADRSHMKYPVLIGRNILYGKFVVDVSKECARKEETA